MEVKRQGDSIPLPRLIMKTMADSDIFEKAVQELDIELSDLRRETRSIDKSAFDISVNPASLVSSITGAMVARQVVKADMLKRQMENDNTTVLQGNYYSQVQNLLQNLKIIFTPFGVVYAVKNGPKEITIETIGTDEMVTSMYQAWQRKDYDFFKNLLLNKMHSEIQFVEHEFAKNLIEKQMALQNGIKKTASEIVPADDLTFIEVIEHVASIKALYEKHTEGTEKLANILLSMVSDFPSYNLGWEFQRPLEKYASFADAISFLGLNLNSKDIRSLQGEYLNPNYLNNRVKVAFLPDRVIFSVDNKMISSLLAMDMNETAFKAFDNQNEKFFENFFKEESKRGILRMKGKLPPDSDLVKKNIEKVAEDRSLASIFNNGNIHPFIYYLTLEKTFGNEWMNWDSYALVKSIEDEFDLKNGISDIPLNKLLSIQASNVSLISYQSYHAFEKILRSLTDKQINFTEREINDITTQDIAFGLDVLDTVTPFDNTYDNFSQETISHIISILVNNNCKLFLPSKVLNSQEKNHFYHELNKYLLDEFNRVEIQGLNNDELESQIIQENEIIQKTGLAILDQVRKYSSKSGFEYESFVDALLEKLGVPEKLRSIISTQVFTNIVIDKYLSIKSDMLEEQKKLFGLR